MSGVSARALSHESSQSTAWSGRQLLLLILLAAVVIVSALGVVYSRFETRQLYMELLALEKLQAELEIEWGKLQLEEGAVSTNGMVEKKAREQLGMQLPVYEAVEHVGR